MELQYLLTNMDATAVVGYVLIEPRDFSRYDSKPTFHAFDTDGAPIFRRKGDPTLVTKVAKGKGMRVMALGYFGISHEAKRLGISAPEYMRSKMAVKAS